MSTAIQVPHLRSPLVCMAQGPRPISVVIGFIVHHERQMIITNEPEKPDEVEAEVYVRMSSLSDAVRSAVRADIRSMRGVTLPGEGK